MKTVKEICLGVAVAGAVAGAGSTVACAVAYAGPDAADSTTSVENAATRPDRAARTPQRGPAARTVAPAAAGRGDSQPDASTDRAADPAPRTSARNNRAVRQPSVSVGTPAVAVDVPDRVVTVDTPQPSAAESAAPTVAPRPVASIRVTRIAATAAALVPAPVTPLIPIAPLPLPLPTPVLPVGAVSPASTTVSRSRQASASLAVVQIGDPQHVLLIGTDGTNLDKILEYAYAPGSGFRTVMDQGITGATSIVGHTTISGPSWTTILTGVWDNKSGVINNLFDPAPYTPWPTVFNQLEYYDATNVGVDIDTAVIADWQYINDIGAAGSYPVAASDNIFVEFSNSWEDTDDIVAQKTIDRITNTLGTQSSFIFSYQVGVDEAGHAYGGGSTQYRDAVINTSQNIKDIMVAVETWEANTGEKWTVIVTTDHGHQQSVGFGHGFQSPNETSSFIMYRDGEPGNNGVQNLGYQNTDITPTIVNLFGAPLRGDFDGVPLDGKSSTIVTPGNLKDALNAAIDFAGYPNIGVDLALGTRTIFASIPYFLNGFVESITGQLQGIVDQDIFLISGLAGVTEFLVQITGDVLVGITQAVARVVAYLTGSGTIAPTTPPLQVPPANSVVVNSQLVLT